jgi:hypothetical protein
MNTQSVQRAAVQPRFALRSRAVVWAIRMPLSLAVAFIAWWLFVFVLSSAASLAGEESSIGAFLVTLLVLVSPLLGGWFVLAVLFFVCLFVSRRVVGVAVS